MTQALQVSPTLDVHVVYGPEHVRYISGLLVPRLLGQRGVTTSVHLLNYASPEAMMAELGPRVRDHSAGQRPPHLGFGGAHNWLAERTQSPLFLVLNPDTLPAYDMARELMAAVRGGGEDVALVDARQVPLTHPKFVDPRTAETPWASGACLMVRRSTFQELGGFDGALFMYCEDVELSWRAWQAGWRVLSAEKAICEHYTGALRYRSDQYYREHFFSARNFLWLARKHFGEQGERRALRMLDRTHFPKAFRSAVRDSWNRVRSSVAVGPRLPHPRVEIRDFNVYHEMRWSS